MQSRTMSIVIGVVVALVIAPAGLAGGGVAGTYTASIKGPATIKGTWVLTLTKGAYRVSLDGRVHARGDHTATPTTITFREPAGCGGSGTYAWRRSGKTMTFVRKREAPTCQIRGAVLSRRFTQVR